MRCLNDFIYLHSENECIMELFKGQSLLEFTERFKTDLDCEEYLASFNKFIKRIVERSPVSQSQLVCN